MTNHLADPLIRLILLPPAMATSQDYVEKGFLTLVASLSLPIEVSCIDIGYEQVMSGTAANYLHEQIAPKENERIWLGGISLGAFNALQFAASYPTVVERLVLFAPYAGTSDVLSAITDNQGIPAEWQTDTTLTDERRWWGWLGNPLLAKPTIDLWLSEKDRFLAGQQLLEKYLPNTKAQWLPGKHEWPVWQQMWQAWVNTVLTPPFTQASHP